MQSKNNLILIILFIFFSCAVQSIPTGGPPDKIGPYIKKINPENFTSNIDNNETIEIQFNEMIDSKKIKYFISVFPDIDITIVTRIKYDGENPVIGHSLRSWTGKDAREIIGNYGSGVTAMMAGGETSLNKHIVY